MIRNGSNRALWLALGVVLFGHTLLVASPMRSSGRTGIVRILILDGITPIEKAFDATLYQIGSVWENYIALIGTRRENERLRDEISELRMAIDRNSVEISEARRLRRLVDLDPLVNSERLVARVIGRDTSTSRQTLTIDRGTIHGLQNDTPVMMPDGIVGRVIYTGHIAAVVQVVSDPESAVGVIAERSRVQGIVRGDGSGFLEFEHLDSETDLIEGERVVTSGMDRIYPKGLPLGIVVENGPDRDLLKTARIEPAADLSRIEEVLCLIASPAATQMFEALEALEADPGHNARPR